MPHFVLRTSFIANIDKSPKYKLFNDFGLHISDFVLYARRVEDNERLAVVEWFHT